MTRLWDVTLHAVILMTAAFVMALAFPRTDWSLTPWVALAPLLAIATIRAPRTAFFWGWASGTLFFLVLLRWLQYTFQVYSAIPWPLVYGPVLLLAAYCGLWTGAVAWAVSWLTARRSAALALAVAPFLWVAAEWLRGHLFGGFPWGTLGYSQYLHLRVIQIAELAGVHGVSFVLLAVNAALAGCVVLRGRHALGGVGAAAVLVAATLAFGAVRLGEAPPASVGRVAIVQPSIEQPLKWEARHTRETLGIYFALLRRLGEQHPALIVWPETAAPTILTRDPALVERFRAASPSWGCRCSSAASTPWTAASATPRSSSPIRGSWSGMIRSISFRSESSCRCRECSGSCAAGPSSSPSWRPGRVLMSSMLRRLPSVS